MEGKKRRPLPLAIYVAVGLSVLLAVIFYWWPGPCEAIDAKIYDYKLQWRSETPIDPDIVHLDIDDDSVKQKQFGSWPWDRKISAMIVDKLTELGAAAIVFDIFFPLEGRSPEGDQALVNSIAKSGRVVSATTYATNPSAEFKDVDKSKERALYKKAWPLRVPRNIRLIVPKNFPDSFVPLATIIDASKEIGHIASTPDPDGVHRRIPLLVEAWNKCLPSLSLAGLAAYWHVDPENIQITDDRRVVVKHSGKVLTIPVEADGTFLINWPDKEDAFPVYFVSDLLGNEPDPALIDKFKGKIVLVAYAVTGTTDMGINPLFKKNFLLSRIHSSAINTFLTGRFIKQIHAFPYLVPLASVISILFAFGCLSVPHRYGITMEIAICLAYVVLLFVCLARWSYEVPCAAPLLLFAVCSTAFLVIQAIFMESEAQRVAGALQRYLSPQMLESILGQDSVMDLSTRRKELSILFADIKGFSTISETVDVEYLEKFLNDFFEAMTRAIFDNQGTVDKFLGDGLLAFFGDPVDLKNHALAAVTAAMQMHAEMARINSKWSSAGINELARGVEIRIGINTGMVVVGNIGSQRRMEYTVLGSAVNLASRLQDAAPAGGTLISSRTWALAKDHLRCKESRVIKVKGVERDITVCEVESVLE